MADIFEGIDMEKLDAEMNRVKATIDEYAKNNPNANREYNFPICVPKDWAR